MSETADETLRQAQLLTLRAVELLGQRIDRLCDTVNNAPQKFAETVGTNTAAVQRLIETIEHERQDNAARFAQLEDELARLKARHG